MAHGSTCKPADQSFRGVFSGILLHCGYDHSWSIKALARVVSMTITMSEFVAVALKSPSVVPEHLPP